MSEVATKTEDLWTPYKTLARTIRFYLEEEAAGAFPISEFENVLKKHKQNFFALLQNPPKNVNSREELKKGMEDGISVRGVGHQVLSRDLYREAIIISDMYDMNEFVALDLLCTAQMQMAYYFDLPRGLVAVLLYYDGRKALLSCLRMLVQARTGISWTPNTRKDVQNVVTSFTNQLMDNGLFARIFELLHTTDLTKELEKLQENMALGGDRHRKQVVDLFNGIREMLAEIVFLWSAQSGLPRGPTLQLLSFMARYQVREDADGKMDDVSVYLLFALLSATDLSFLQDMEDCDERVLKLPIIADDQYLQMMCDELAPSKPKWVCEGLQGIAMFALTVTLSYLPNFPGLPPVRNAPDFDKVLDKKPFNYFNEKILENVLVFDEDAMLRRLHFLISDFLVNMFSEVKTLRTNAEGTAHTLHIYSQQGIDPPANLPKHFEQLLLLIGRLYDKDPSKLELMLEYWSPLEIYPNETTFSYKTPPRTASLFKFVTFAGHAMPPSLFVPYLKMLAGLSNCSRAARHCFNMLKQQTVGNLNASLSWDHFFASFNQYYNNLRQEVAAPLTDTVYRRGHVHKGITPQEIEGLHAVLYLIRRVAERDDFSRLALCEHPSWSPLTILLGLVGCSVPIPLKADLLLTLASLSLSTETAMYTWNNLEASQILSTIPSTSSYQPRGISSELEEIECRMEEYPLTRAFLKLLDVLIDAGIPRTLGAGPRRPGFDPYLTFIMNAVFLKFPSRPYKNPEEKWQVCSACLHLFEKLLMAYEPQQTDFRGIDNERNDFNCPPGFHLMIQLHSKSEFLNLILLIVEEGIKSFRHFARFPGREHLERSTSSALSIIGRGLALLPSFSDFISNSGCPIILPGLNKLLLTINPRTGQPDYCLTVAKYVMYRSVLPKHTLVAIKILTQIITTPSNHTQFLHVLLSSEKESASIRNGFVECLDSATADDDVNIKEAIVHLLIRCLPFSPPNLSHFLLGFDMKENVSETVFQLPGVYNFPRTCIHSLFSILRKSRTRGLGRETTEPTLIEMVYHTLYLLCANSKTSEPVSKYLRLDRQFFEDHLHFCADNANEGVSRLNRLSWLLKTIAIELKRAADKSQYFYLQKLCRLLTDLPGEDNESVSIVRDSESTSPMGGGGGTDDPPECLILQLFARFELNVPKVASPRWEYFDGTVLEAMLNSCVIGEQTKLIDVKRLHRKLMDEVASLQGSAALGQRQSVMQEVQKVLLHAVTINNSRTAASSIIQFVDAWRRIVQVVSVYVPFEVLSPSNRQILSMRFLTGILRKANSGDDHDEMLPGVATYLSGTVLIVTENLLRSYEREKLQSKTTTDSSNTLIHKNASAFKTIFKHLVEWIMKSDVAAQTARINLYGSLVTFLRMLDAADSIRNAESEDTFYVSRLDCSRLRSSRDRPVACIPAHVLSIHGEKLLELICHDCVSGHEACKMLAIFSFNLLVHVGGNSTWIDYISGRGFLKYVIDSVFTSDEDLKQLLEPVPVNLKSLCLYTSRMCLLTEFASSSKIGAELLLENKLLSCLSTMTVFSLHPEITKPKIPAAESAIEDYILPIETRYLQLLLPVFDVCNSILTSLGTENRSANLQVAYFLMSHSDVIELILRSGSPLLSADFLDELSCLTCLLARMAGSYSLQSLTDAENLQANRAHVFRIQKLTLSLLPKFLLSGEVLKDLLRNGNPRMCPSFQTSDRLLHALKIVANLVGYARNVIETKSVDRSAIDVIFRPSLGSDDGKDYGSHKPLSLGIIVQHLVHSVGHYHREKQTYDFLQQKIKELPDMNAADLNDLLRPQPESKNDRFLKDVASQVLYDGFAKKRLELQYCTYIVDNALYILWAHLDFYMLKAIPRTAQTGTCFSAAPTLASASEATWKVSTDDIGALKRGLFSVINDSFSQKLVSASLGQTDGSRDFKEALLRKIKRLIQFVPVQ